MIRVILICMTLLICVNVPETPAYTPSEGNIGAAFGGHLLQSSGSSKWLGSLGLLMHGDLGLDSSLELGLFHQNKESLLYDKGKMLYEVSQVLHFSMGYRYWWSRWFSTSVGIFSAYPFGVKQVYRNEFSSSQPHSSLSENSIYGLDVAFQINNFKSDGSGPLFEFRYSEPFKPKAGELFSHISLYLGWSFLLQRGRKAMQEPLTTTPLYQGGGVGRQF